MTQPESTPKLFTVEAAALYLQSIGCSGVTVRTVRSLIASGGVAHVRLGKRYYVPQRSLDGWISSHERRAR